MCSIGGRHQIQRYKQVENQRMTRYIIQMATIRELKWLSGKINFKTTKNIIGDKWGHFIVFKMSAH